jgi:hypothetical protein
MTPDGKFFKARCMRVVTYATDARGYFAQFLESAERHGVRVEVLGWGRPWRGFGARLRAVAEFLGRLDPDEGVLSTHQ